MHTVITWYKTNRKEEKKNHKGGNSRKKHFKNSSLLFKS